MLLVCLTVAGTSAWRTCWSAATPTCPSGLHQRSCVSCSRPPAADDLDSRRGRHSEMTEWVAASSGPIRTTGGMHCGCAVQARKLNDIVKADVVAGTAYATLHAQLALCPALVHHGFS